jgi:hypothetical protein
MMKALHVIVELESTFCGTLFFVVVCVYYVASKDFLPEGEASRGTWGGREVSICL